ncbi:hypothetical protein ACFV30_11575 [Streptomyces sp. NPDC059752]|uniref:hypothetical protein n=1 Tax=unclassified Streptomyces TaxID=2593676 RepID=UPI00364C130D
MKSTVAAAALAVGLVGALAPSASAAYTQAKNFSFTDEGVGDAGPVRHEQRRSGPGRLRLQDRQVLAARPVGRPSRMVLRQRRTYWKEFNNDPASSYYVQIANAPHFVHSSGRVVYNWK